MHVINIFIILKLAAKVDVNLKISSHSAVQRTFEVGTTPLLKSGNVFSPVTNEYMKVPYVENKKILATTTTVL